MLEENLVNDTDELKDNQGLIEVPIKPTTNSSYEEAHSEPFGRHFNRPATMVQMMARGNCQAVLMLHFSNDGNMAYY